MKDAIVVYYYVTGKNVDEIKCFRIMRTGNAQFFINVEYDLLLR